MALGSPRVEWRPASAVKWVGRRLRRPAMRRAVTVIALLVLATGSFLVIPEQAKAGSSTDAALALGAFAVFNQIVRGETIFNGSPHVVRETVVVQQPAVVYAPPPVVYAPPPVVVYPSYVYYYPSYGYLAPGYYPEYYGAYRVR